MKARTLIVKRVKGVGKLQEHQHHQHQPHPQTQLLQLLQQQDHVCHPLLVYTIGVKFRGLNKKEEYAPCHMFSLSENVANKMITTNKSGEGGGSGGGGGGGGGMMGDD